MDKHHLRHLRQDLLDHVVGVGARAAGAVPAQRTVHVGREMVGEIGDLEAALQAGLAAHDAPGQHKESSHHCLRAEHQGIHLILRFR